MPARIFCTLDEPTVVSGGMLSGRVVIVMEGGAERRDLQEETPNVYFRLVGTETVRVFKGGVGARSASRVFIDTVFTLEETFSECFELDLPAFLVRFRFALPRSLPSSLSLADLHARPCPSKTIWFDASSGVHYTLFASLEPVSHHLIRRLEQGKLSRSKSGGGGASSMDLYTTIPVDALQDSDSFPTDAALRFHLDSFLEEAMLHRGPLVGSATKKIAGDSFFSSFSDAKPVTVSVNIDQYVVVLGAAFPVLLTINNASGRAVTTVDTRLVATVSARVEDADFSVEYTACHGPALDLVVAPGSQVEDTMFWIKLPEDIKIPSSHLATLFKLTYDFVTTAVLSDGSSLEVRIPVFVSRGVQLRNQAKGSAAALEAEPAEPALAPVVNVAGDTKQNDGAQPS